jgi:hypothetical protein
MSGPPAPRHDRSTGFIPLVSTTETQNDSQVLQDIQNKDAYQFRNVLGKGHPNDPILMV